MTKTTNATKTTTKKNNNMVRNSNHSGRTKRVQRRHESNTLTSLDLAPS